MQRLEFNLSDYWRIVRRRKAVIIASALFVTAIVFYKNYTTPPLFKASAVVMVEMATSLMTGARDYYYPYEGDFFETQQHVIASKPVGEEAGRYIGLISETTPAEERDRIAAGLAGSVNADKVGSTNLISINATAVEAGKAAAIANAIAHGYQVWSLKNRNEQARKVREFVEGQLKETGARLAEGEDTLKKFQESSEEAGQITALQSQLMNLQVDMATLLQQYTEQHPDVIEQRARIAEVKEEMARNPGLQLEYARLKREVDTNNALYSNLRQRYQDAKIREAEKISGVTIVNAAEVPGYPISPKTRANTMFALMVGLLLGFVLAFVKENLDTSIATIEDVEDFLGLPILGVIPQMETDAGGGRKFSFFRLFESFIPSPPHITKREMRRLLVLIGGGTSAPVEAYKTLRANIQFAVLQKKSRVLLFSSSGPHEGKTITASNCAIAFAQNGQKVLLASADLRRAGIADVFGLRSEPGLSEVISGDVDWKKSLRTIEDLMVGELDTAKLLETPGIDNLSILTAGRVPPNPAEFLQSERMKSFIKEAREVFDFVLLDCPPVLPVSDALVLSPFVDGIVLIYQTGQTARGALKRAKSMLASAGVEILGVVLNGIKAQEMKLAPSYRYYGGYYGGKYGSAYGYGYGPEEEPKKKPGWWPFGNKVKKQE
ncbi:MAG: polysaccharide biosynthesis tyrosine autokinase [Pseudomonadota bacterium]